MKDSVPNSQVLELIAILEREQRPYHFSFESGRIFLYLDGIEAELSINTIPLSDLAKARTQPKRWLAITLAWLSLLSLLLFVIGFHS